MSANPEPAFSSIEHTVAAAQAGDAHALEDVLRFCQEPVYHLALRMVWNPSDAEDATQEILIKVLTHLSQFRHASRFTTWVYRIATNHLLALRQQHAERRGITFAALRALDHVDVDKEAEIAEPSTPDTVDEGLRLAEITRQCTLGMLLHLNRAQRVVYILGEIFEVSSEEGAAILAITPAAFRKRLSRARLNLRAYMAPQCGLVNPAAGACACGGGTCPSTSQTEHNADPALLDQAAGEWQQIYRMAALFRSHPQVATPTPRIEDLKQFLGGNALALLQP
jgi:RNA polymerase sigma factor (sigma-70 family)